MKILIACEESQTVCKEFRALGHEAYSCDILPASGGHPEWHIQDNVLNHLKEGWDMMVAHPPCTHLAVSGAPHFHKKQKEQIKAIRFVRYLLECNIPKICLENPVSIISTQIRKPDQIIQPFFFGDPIPKKTCLWLKNLPPLIPTKIVEPEYILYNSKKSKSGKSRYSVFGKLGKGKGKERSKTFPGIAKAMAEQWGNLSPTSNYGNQ